MARTTGRSSEALRSRLVAHRQAVLDVLGNLRNARDRGALETCGVVTDLETAAQIRAAERRLTGLDVALERLEMGLYGVCERCGDGISPDRLDALPSTGSCRKCA